jgi:hypothetical protein
MIARFALRSARVRNGLGRQELSGAVPHTALRISHSPLDSTDPHEIFNP